MSSETGRLQDPDSAHESLSPQISRTSTRDGGSAGKDVVNKLFESFSLPASTAEPVPIRPSLIAKQKDTDQSGEFFDPERRPREHRASISGKRLSGRPSKEALETLSSSKRQSFVENAALAAALLSQDDPDSSAPQTQHRHSYDRVINQIGEWIKNEKARRAARRAKRNAHGSHTAAATDDAASSANARRASQSSEGSVALEQLTDILERNISLKSNDDNPQRRRMSVLAAHGAHGAHKIVNIMKRNSTITSDTDFVDGEPIVPKCEAILDNSKTLAYSGGSAESEADTAKGSSKDNEAWASFKYEILRITHTLRLKGWRRVSLERSGDIEVERLSGALTNAVYVVSPPKQLFSKEEQNGMAGPLPKNPPPKLLLRIYGPQVEHLIDREAELQILRRLARKRIGPRLLGTFTNGRFEEFFHAKTLTPQDLRTPDTSKQIAKRMRELHEGIELEKQEREDGPFVWRNWDKWVDRCEQIVTWLDQQILESKTETQCEKWRRHGLVCGVEWPVFRQLIEKYRAWLDEQYGGAKKVNERLVFAHNDTQYGNILRLIPAGESPLLLPANEHKRLVVIDFEYANANLPGLEFANHFTEWCYNYHDPTHPHICNTSVYPTPAEQHRFIRSYLLHNPSFKAPGGSATNPPTPSLDALPSSGSMTSLVATNPSSSISAFMLDSRAPPGAYGYHEQEAEREKKVEEETKRLMAETRLWRLANSAQWVAWGIVQANIPGLPDFDNEAKKGEKKEDEDWDRMSPEARELESATLEMRVEAKYEGKEEKVKEDGAPAQAEDEEFDYLGYAQDRAMFVWGDAIKLGIVKEEEVPEDLRKRVKIVEF
ncbi:kinase-like protein [Delitschia confertaspora ATCC 74209]|uniref:Kinase-like protein n=1 Tax=Delitschia confertaspora ATCC 74209 TaxID=1513339 RepID=A0A9P4JT92_9PLEO|nr:kinase-like protein [Delitschia confertaspora ATCC 74209]